MPWSGEHPWHEGAFPQRSAARKRALSDAMWGIDPMWDDEALPSAPEAGTMGGQGEHPARPIEEDSA